MLKQSTQVPNYIFDTCLKNLSETELKVLLIVVRQTLGWVVKGSHARKKRDRITSSQFQEKTGLSKRAVTKAVKGLTLRKLIEVSDFNGKILLLPRDRKGKSYLYYSLANPVHKTTPTSAQKVPELVHETHNKQN